MEEWVISHLSSDCTCTGKQCTQCDKVQCIEGFHRYSRSPDGRRSLCKVCRKAKYTSEEFKARRREHHKENADHINEKKREWSHANSERERERSSRYRAENPEKVKAAQREANRSERGKQRYRNYRTRHPEKVKQFSKAWREAHPEMEQEHAKVRAANYKARQVGVPGTITTEQWRELKTQFQNTCLRCKRQEPEITLTPDHIIPFHLHGVNEISNIQPLCVSCNISKGVKVIDYRLDHKEEDCG